MFPPSRRRFAGLRPIHGWRFGSQPGMPGTPLPATSPGPGRAQGCRSRSPATAAGRWRARGPATAPARRRPAPGRAGGPASGGGRARGRRPAPCRGRRRRGRAGGSARPASGRRRRGPRRRPRAPRGSPRRRGAAAPGGWRRCACGSAFPRARPRAGRDGGLPGPVRDGFDVGGHGEHPSWERFAPMEDRFACGGRRNPAGECRSPVQRRPDGPAGRAGNRPGTRYGNRNPAAGTPERRIPVLCQGVRRKKPE